jgi:glutamine synthetase
LRKTLRDAEKMGFNSYKTAAEPEFYLFKDNTPIDKAGYFDTSPMDKTNEVKKEVINALIELGIEWEMGHHEAGPGQLEVDIPYADALKTAANILLFKNVAQSVAQKFEINATFMPKPMEGQAGNGMHIHQSLWKDGENIFFDEKDEYQLSDVARYAIGGQLEHAKAIAAVTNSTINSYKRLGEFEAPKYIYWGKMNRDALVRVPDFVGKKSARIEYRSPDPLCNPYLCFAVLLAATLDGIKRKINPPNPVEEDIYESGSYKKIETLPNNLAEALEELEDDKVIRGTLGGAYEPFIEIKRKEWENYSMRTITDWERRMYF